MLTFSHPGSRIPDPGVKKVPNPGSRIPDPGSATLDPTLAVISASDPDSLTPDPGLLVNPDPDPEPGFNDQKQKLYN